MNSTDKVYRKPTPPDVALQLRREAGFGCCRCGFPFIEYHHIVPYSHDEHFRAEDMMVLCPTCHAMTTRGALTETEQRKYKHNPRNIRRGYATGLLSIHQDYCAASFGSVQFVGEGPLVVVDGEPILSLKLGDDGQLEFSIKLYDKSDQPLLHIDSNEWRTGDPAPWDIEFKFNYIKLRRKKRDIALEIDSSQNPITIRADLWRHRQNLSLGPRDVFINGVVKNFGLIDLALVAMRIDIDTKLETASLVPDPNFGAGMFVSEADLQERLRRGRDAWRSLGERS